MKENLLRKFVATWLIVALGMAISIPAFSAGDSSDKTHAELEKTLRALSPAEQKAELSRLKRLRGDADYYEREDEGFGPKGVKLAKNGLEKAKDMDSGWKYVAVPAAGLGVGGALLGAKILNIMDKATNHAIYTAIDNSLAKPFRNWGDNFFKKFWHTPDLIKKWEQLYPETVLAKGKIHSGRVIRGRTSSMIFNRRIGQELEAVRTTYIEALKQDRPLPPLILYGPPGTGKTDFVERMVNEVAHEIPKLPFMMVKLTGRSIADAGATKLTELFRHLENEKKKVFLLIDEIDPIFDRGFSKQDESLIGKSNLTSVILSAYGVASSKFVIIGTTNHPFIYEDAVRQRFPTFRVDLPNALTRENLILRLFWDSKIGHQDAMVDTRESFRDALFERFTLPQLEQEFVSMLEVDEYSMTQDGDKSEVGLPLELRKTKLEKVLAFIRQENKINQIVDEKLESKYKNRKKEEILSDFKDKKKTIDLSSQDSDSGLELGDQSELLAKAQSEKFSNESNETTDLETDEEEKVETKDKTKGLNGKDVQQDKEKLDALIERRRAERAKTYNLIELSQGLAGRDFALIHDTYMKKIALFNDRKFSRSWMALSMIDRLAEAYNAQEFETKRKKELEEKQNALRWLQMQADVRSKLQQQEAAANAQEGGYYYGNSARRGGGGEYYGGDYGGIYE